VNNRGALFTGLNKAYHLVAGRLGDIIHLFGVFSPEEGE
jgi:hypothetical protein